MPGRDHEALAVIARLLEFRFETVEQEVFQPAPVVNFPSMTE